jgi:hypothetical protein
VSGNANRGSFAVYGDPLMVFCEICAHFKTPAKSLNS